MPARRSVLSDAVSTPLVEDLVHDGERSKAADSVTSSAA